ncbi:MAG: hypothetical protein AAB490_03725 [Patescibacteria group bacterium]
MQQSKQTPIIVALGLVLLSASSVGYAQTSDENLKDTVEFSATFSELESEFDDASVRFENALEENDQAVPSGLKISFFDGQNLGLWLSWTLLAALLLLLAKVRHTLLKSRTVTLESSVPLGDTTGTDPLRDILAKKKETATALVTGPRGLVQPVKTVKIKVRKIVKKK